MPDIMKMGKNPNYLGSWDLEELPEREVVLTIKRIVDEDVFTNGSKESCTVCHWVENGWKPMILNVTNKKMMCRLYKTKDTEKLAGKAVVIGVEEVKAFGGTHEALRIQKRLPKTTGSAKCAVCGNTIQGGGGRSADYIVAKTQKLYGACMCFACATKRAEAEKANQQKDVTNNGTA